MPLVHSAIERLTSFAVLAATIAIVAVLWLGVLPQIGRTVSVRKFIDHNEKFGIDPSVKFYSELPAMRAIQSKVSDIRRRNSTAFE